MDIFWNHTLPNFIEVSSLQPIPPPLPKLTGTLYPARPESGSPSAWEVIAPGQYPGLRLYYPESVPVTDSEQVSQKQPESLHHVRVTETVETFPRFVYLSILWLVINTAVLVLCMWKNEIQSGYQMLSFNGGCTHILLLYFLCVHRPLLTPPTRFLGLYYVLFSHRPIRLTQCCTQIGNSNPLGIKRFVPGISLSFKCECHIIMQIQYTKNPNLGRFELGTTLS